MITQQKQEEYLMKWTTHRKFKFQCPESFTETQLHWCVYISAALMLQQHSWVAVTEPLWRQSLKLTIWRFTEKVCPSRIWKQHFIVLKSRKPNSLSKRHRTNCHLATEEIFQGTELTSLGSVSKWGVNGLIFPFWRWLRSSHCKD